MHSDNNLIQQWKASHPKSLRASQYLEPLAFIVIIFLESVIAAAIWCLFSIKRNQPVSQVAPKRSTQTQMINSVTPIPLNPTVTEYQPTLSLGSTDPYDVSKWETFTSPMEGFTLRYPQNWTVKNNALKNCGVNAASYDRGVPVYISGTPTPKYCRDSFEFISPDGKASVRYVQLSDYRSDRSGCGIHAPCYDQMFDVVEELP